MCVICKRFMFLVKVQGHDSKKRWRKDLIQTDINVCFGHAT